ncbi:Eukaryotic aspartyl protease family protein [Striga hermonthica]|uniref:Eukaryotic aspartyl protease family protein n=1 Tax=Striga hermonthica TaxID=68872 RepID=A0A9N7R727_STRHE|nr:Eukaryotic aspartyl protease family protein [Striga hermonthica]
MASCKSLFLIFLTTLICICDSTTTEKKPPARSQSFRLALGSLSKSSVSKYAATSSSSSHKYKSSVHVSMAPIVSLPIGTPPQLVPVVLDTGSQLPWAHCAPKKSPSSGYSSAFIPSLSTSYRPVLCHNNSDCPTSNPDLVPPTCTKLRCTYSIFYADSMSISGSLFHETFTFNSDSPVILGCSPVNDSSGAQGILGMNLGNFSLVSQLGISKFSYCISSNNLGFFYIGDNTNDNNNNPNHVTKRIDFTWFPDEAELRPSLDKDAYTVHLVAIRINGTKLNVSESAFWPDANGSGQTIIDSATEPTYLVDQAYAEVKTRVESLTGARFNMTSSQSFEMCFRGNNVTAAAQAIGDLGLEFDGGVEMVIPMERAMVNVGDGVSCVGILNSGLMNRPGSILGYVMFKDVRMEYDVVNKKIGFGEFGGCGS